MKYKNSELRSQVHSLSPKGRGKKSINFDSLMGNSEPNQDLIAYKTKFEKL